MTTTFAPWVYRIAVNCCIDYMRKKKRNAHTVSLTISLDTESGEQGKEQDIADLTYAPDAALESRELSDMLHAAIGQLSEKLQAIIILKEIEGFTYDEIAEILDCSRGTVKSRLFRARERLKELLAPVIAAQT